MRAMTKKQVRKAGFFFFFLFFFFLNEAAEYPRSRGPWRWSVTQTAFSAHGRATVRANSSWAGYGSVHQAKGSSRCPVSRTVMASIILLTRAQRELCGRKRD